MIEACTTKVRKTPRLTQNLGQLQPFIAVYTPTGMRGPPCIFRASLTPFSLQHGEATWTPVVLSGGLIYNGGSISALIAAVWIRRGRRGHSH